MRFGRALVLASALLAFARVANADPSPPPPEALFVSDVDAVREEGRVHVHVGVLGDGTGAPAILWRGTSSDRALAVAVPGSPTVAQRDGVDLYDRAPLSEGEACWYWGQLVDRTGQVVLAGPVAPHRPWATALTGAAPNPSAAGTSIAFTVGSAAPLTLTVVDARGRVVRTLAAGTYAASSYEVAWDGRDDRGQRVARGVYFVRLVAGGRRFTRKLVRTR